MGERMSVCQEAPTEEVLSLAEGVLRGGGVIVVPTDSVYGIGCAATPSNPAHGRIFEIKRRERSQTLPWLVADAADLERYGRELPAWARSLALAFWPGALTLVVRASEAVGGEYMAHDSTVALRVPDSVLVRELARRVGPLATTSANTHGQAAATSGQDIEERIAQAADLVLDAGPAPLAVASTIVSCTGTHPVVLREGAIPSQVVYEVCGM